MKKNSIIIILAFMLILGGCSSSENSNSDFISETKPIIEYNSAGVYKGIFSVDESKEVNLGTIAKGEYAVVAVSPLDLNPGLNKIFDGQIEVDFSAENRDNIVISSSQNINNNQKKKSRSISNKVSNNLEQVKVDAQMRQFENELIKKQEFFKKPKNMVAIQSTTYSLGDQKEFKLADDYDQENPPTITASVKRISKHAYIFVDDNYYIASSKLDTFAAEFDNQIFATDMDYFANYDYNSGGYDFDSNEKVIILITELDNDPKDGTLMGYFAPWDLFSEKDYVASNQADMLYINSWAVDNYELNQNLGTLAHEFQHLLFFVEKVNAERRYVEDTWINEGFSGLAEYLNGYYSYTGDARIIDSEGESGYFNYPQGESLLYWNSQLSDYGASNLFAYYLYQKYGTEVIKDIMTSDQDPIDLISNQYEGFSKLFLDWAITNYITDNSNNRFGQYNYPMQLEYYPNYVTLNESYNRDDFTINDTGVKYYLINGSGVNTSLKINLSEKTGIVVYRSDL
ncbi:hypothetical protein [Orenia marismortui]|uniref:Peptidase M30-like protein n=1 Tax=Orenia marismortui TaxID=46469 RepID=A0A4R8HAJ6_9FIRM|nr:hypothetical protein [Orenia marismortui]TDX52955.1 hypothetical protein C7959_10481 [Orenia marismortui]